MIRSRFVALLVGGLVTWPLSVAGAAGTREICESLAARTRPIAEITTTLPFQNTLLPPVQCVEVLEPEPGGSKP